MNGSSGFSPRNKQEKTFAKRASSLRAFSLFELLVIVAVMAILAAMVVPMVGSAAQTKLSAVADAIASDIAMAREMAVMSGSSRTVVFEKEQNKYAIKDKNENVVAHPIKKGFDYVVNLDDDSLTAGVNLTAIDFDGKEEVTFDNMGCPYKGKKTDYALAATGTVTISIDSMSLKISVSPDTGFVTVSSL